MTTENLSALQKYMFEVGDAHVRSNLQGANTIRTRTTVGADSSQNVPAFVIGQHYESKVRISSTQGLNSFWDEVKGPTDAATSDITASTILYVGQRSNDSLHLNGTTRNLICVSGDLYDWEVLGEPMPEPVFKALNNAADVQTGTGGLTTDWASGGYVWNGSVYEAVAPNTPIWVDGWLQYFPAMSNDQIHSHDLTNAEWTATNMSVALDSTGADGTANTGNTLTASAANATVIANAVTAASATHSTVWVFKRSSGTGTVNITVDGGTTWQDITSLLTSGYLRIAADQATVTNPQIGVQVVASGDSVIVGNAELHLNKTAPEV